MDFFLKDRVAAVAGASAGLGYATALTLAQEGCHVGICGRRTGALENAARSIREATGTEVFTVHADVGQPADARHFIQSVGEHFGRLDIVVSNVGGPPSIPFAQTTVEQWEQAINSILLGAISMFQEALPLVRKSDHGRLIAITSVGAKEPLPNLVLSNATRAALHGIVKTLSKEVADAGITVNAICPSAIRTDRQTELAQQASRREGITLEDAFAQRVTSVPLGRMGDPMEFAAAVAFLCSKQAAFITGIALPVDGGVLVGLP